MAETACKIRRFALTPGVWTPIIAPCSCSYLSFAMEDGSAIQRCSDPDNPDATWYAIPSGLGYQLNAPRLGPHRFVAGDVVTFIKGSGTLIAEFIS